MNIQASGSKPWHYIVRLAWPVDHWQALDGWIMSQITTETKTTKTVLYRSIRESIPGLCAVFFCWLTLSLVQSIRVFAVRAAAELRPKQLMQRKPPCKPTVYVSGVQAVFVISAWVGRRTVCVCLCVHTGVEGFCMFGVGIVATLKKDLNVAVCFWQGDIQHTYTHTHFPPPISVLRTDYLPMACPQSMTYMVW